LTGDRCLAFEVLFFQETQTMKTIFKKPEDLSKEIKKITHSDIEDGVVDNSYQENEELDDVVEAVILKIPQVTVIYWCEKMTATTFGETFADYWTQTLDFGYAGPAIVLLLLFFISLAFQLKVKTYWPLLFWLVMSTSSIAGTTISDFIDRALHWGYPLGMSILLSILLVILACWKLTGEPMNVAGAMSRKAEAFYWTSILVSNTLGTALGDFLSDSLEIGFGISALIIGCLLLVCAGLVYVPRVSHVLLFWVAFVLTRPFGATFGDFLTKSKAEGGLDLGTLNASLVILALFAVFFAVEMHQIRKSRKLIEEEQNENEKEDKDQTERQNDKDKEDKDEESN
jgi:uncharacterized membrane-anchored protein